MARSQDGIAPDRVRVQVGLRIGNAHPAVVGAAREQAAAIDRNAIWLVGRVHVDERQPAPSALELDAPAQVAPPELSRLGHQADVGILDEDGCAKAEGAGGPSARDCLIVDQDVAGDVAVLAHNDPRIGGESGRGARSTPRWRRLRGRWPRRRGATGLRGPGGGAARSATVTPEEAEVLCRSAAGFGNCAANLEGQAIAVPHQDAEPWVEAK
eukprot:7584437-Alexandrium_andersonii.AAC.1